LSHVISPLFECVNHYPTSLLAMPNSSLLRRYEANLRAVNDVFACQAGDVRARLADVFAFDDRNALPALSEGSGSDCSPRAAAQN